MGKVEVAVHFAGSLYLSSFNAAMFQCGMINKVRFLAILKIKSDIITELRLISFDREMIMRLSLLNQIAGKLALCQQGIGGNLLALDINILKQRNYHLNLVGLFDFFIAFSRHGAYFFWA